MNQRKQARGQWLDAYEQIEEGPLLNLRGRVQLVPVYLMRYFVVLEYYEVFVKSGNGRPTRRIYVRRVGEGKISEAAKLWAEMEKARCQE